MSERLQSNDGNHLDPMDQFSDVISQIELCTPDGSELGKVITRKRRENPEKPQRTLGVAWDDRDPMVPEFSVKYSYIVRFNRLPDTSPEPAGRHWHEIKNEIMTAAHGRFKVVLEDRVTKQQAEYILSSEARDESGVAIEQSVYVPTSVAHAVVPLDVGASSLLVIADHPGTLDDEFAYEMDIR